MDPPLGGEFMEDTMTNNQVALAKVHPNPYRNLPEYPIDPAKIERLKASIKKTGFWDNIVARERQDGGVEIAYGHHRIEALRKMYPKTHEIGVIVRDLDDGTMIQIMASENDEVYALGNAVINETVKAARDFLREHPEKKRTAPLSKRAKETHVEATAITAFLSWPQSRVEEALAQLTSFEAVAPTRTDGKPPPVLVSKKLLDTMPTQRQATAFRSAIKKHGVPAQHHARLAAEIVKDDTGYRGIDALVAGVLLKQPRDISEEDLFRTVVSAARALDKTLLSIQPLRKGIKAGHYNASHQYGQMLGALRSVAAASKPYIGD